MGRAAIIASGFYVPEQILDNSFFVRGGPYKIYSGRDSNGDPVYSKEGVFLTEDKILNNTGGMKERRKIAGGEDGIDLIERAFKKTGFPPEELRYIIVATVTDEIRFPSLACRAQKRIGANRVKYSADVGAACSGFTHALDHGRLIVQEEGGTCLVAGVETLTRIVDYEEVNCDLFGDGCGLVILGSTYDAGKGILATEFDSDITGIDLIYRDKHDKLRMPGGPDVFKKATRGMVEIAHRLVEKAGIRKEDIDLYIPHQANGRILDSVEVKVGKDKVYRNIEKYGNMSSATVPVALAEAIECGRAKKGDLVCLVDMGSGLAFGGALIRL